MNQNPCKTWLLVKGSKLYNVSAIFHGTGVVIAEDGRR